MADRQFLSPQDLADMFGVPVSTVYQWNHRGTSPRFIRVGKHIRYMRDDVLAWCESHASTPRSAA